MTEVLTPQDAHRGELDPGLVGNNNGRTGALGGSGTPGGAADKVQAEQVALLKTLATDEHGASLVAQLLGQLPPEWRKDEHYCVVGDGEIAVSFPVLEDRLTEWTLDHITAWCPPGNSNAAEVEGNGNVTSPGANAVIASATIPAAGAYNVTVVMTLTGTAEVAVNNANVRNSGIASIGIPTISGQAVTIPLGQLNLAAGALTVNAINAGTVGANYQATIIATPVTTGGTVNVQLGAGVNAGGNMFKIPAVIPVTKAIQNVLIQLPITQPEVTSLAVQGMTGDRVAVIFVYKRGG